MPCIWIGAGENCTLWQFGDDPYCRANSLNGTGSKGRLAPVSNVRGDYPLDCRSLVNELHQNFVLERFCEEAKGSGIQCGLAD